ncbi:MAG: porin, partial [Phaeodactylibacter sp.]|nr:porin [Phaeodactylibacter sp.]
QEAAAKPAEDHSYKPLTLKLNEDGSKYIRFITWHQMWTTFSQDANDNIQTEFRLRRSRFLAFAQVSPRFLILTHFGLNNLTRGGMDATGQLAAAQLFMHDAWAEYRVVDKFLYIGGGLHYWNGISRLTNQSTLNIMSLDAPRFNWATIGTSDQFARHLGLYAKGKLGRLDYRVSVNEAIANTLDGARGLKPAPDTAVYVNDGGKVYSGYFNYQFLDKESNKLPFMVGTYIGKKKVFNIGAGFLSHPGGSTSLDGSGNEVANDVLLWAADAYYDAPVGSNGSAISAYLAFYNFNFGPNYQLTGSSDLVATGNILYGQLGFALPAFSNGTQLMPYVTYSNRSIEAAADPANQLGVGFNYFISGHNAKVTVEYNSNKPAVTTDRTNILRIQGMIFL